MESLFVKELLHTAYQYENKSAIVDNNGKRGTTYGEMLALAGKVSFFIKQKKIPVHSFVCIQMFDSMEFMAVEFGVWLAQCVAVPIGMNSPRKRVETIMQHCNSPILIDETIIRVINDMNNVCVQEYVVPQSCDNALLIYTSGSTGIPKGILHTFESFDVNYPHFGGIACPSPEQVFGNAAPFYFIAIVFMYDMLRAGATVHIYADNVKSDVDMLQQYILAHDITVSYISPAVLLRFRNVSPQLKAVVTAGEKLTTQCSRDGYVLYNLYGLSETAGTVTTCAIGSESVKNVPLGKCNPGVEYRIVDENGSDVALGKEGELYLRGSFCKEYYKDVKLTKTLYHNGWLSTGDIVEQGDDGLLYYKNRKDWMVKVNGQRVEPGEVEAAICKMNGVHNVIVKGFDNGKGSQYLCAFYIADHDIDTKIFYAHLDRLIPIYMHPTLFVRMESFPLNANGKINRIELIAPKINNADIEQPKNNREAFLMEIAQKVLGFNNFGVSDNLVNLGMDSITATKMVSMAAQQHILLKVNDLRLHPTIRELAKSKMSLLYWYQPYQKNKPVLVFSCGIIGAKQLEQRMQSLYEYYNILVVEPFFEHYMYIAGCDEAFEDIVGLYYDIMDIMIEDKSKIIGFIGFSFGGTIAYALAQMLFQETGKVSRVVCGDSPLCFSPYTKLTPAQEVEEINKIISRNEEETIMSAKIIFNGYQAVLRLMSNWAATPSSSKVLLFHCVHEEFGNLPRIYDKCVKHLTIVNVEDEHTEFCLDSNRVWHEFTINHTLSFFS